MTDDIVAAHLAAALILVVRNSTPKLPPPFISILEAVRAERKKRYEPPKGGTGRY
jgi:hypothetical protein